MLTQHSRLFRDLPLFVSTFVLVLSWGNVRAADVAEKSWQPDSAQWHWGRDRQVDLLHTHIDVALDPAVVRVDGKVTLTFVPLQDGLRHADFDAAELTLEQVTDRSGRALPFSVHDQGFTVEFDPPLRTSDTAAITIAYHGTPTIGLYFIPSQPLDPDKVPMIWSQGEAEENRYWFPGYDYPNDKGTTSVSVRTPRPNVVVSNGKMLKLDEHSDGTRTFHWACGVPNSTYLIAVAVGQFDSLVQKSASGVRCVYYCRKGLGSRLEPSMSETPDMIDFYERATGVPFPYEQYAQVMVTDFIHGGMENAGMTINTETTLHSARTHDFYRDRTNALLAHEGAHQWFGDLVTLNDWSEAWLNEGFASYVEDLWIEHRWGRDRFLLSMANTHEGGVGAARTRRSTVHHRYVHSDDLFGSYAYSRGASVLHMLRGQLGDSLWRASIKRYLKDNYAQNVETVDLKRATEETTGREMDGFFDQWIFHGGHPELDVETEYDSDQRMLTISIEQTQEVDDVTPVFRFPIEIEWVTAAGRQSHSFDVSEKHSTFYVSTTEEPQYVLIDSEGWVLAEIEHKQPTSALLKQAKDSVRVLARKDAIAQLGEKTPSDEILATLTDILWEDPMAGIRSAAADALGELGSEAARDSLLAGLVDADPAVRNRVIYALAKFEGDDVAFGYLETIAESDEMEPLRGSAIDAASSVDPDRAAPMAKAAVTGRSEKYTIEVDAFSALRSTNDAALIPLGMRYARPGHPTAVRIAALGLISSLAKYEKEEQTRHDYSRQLEKYLDDRNMNLRKPLMRAIGVLGRPGAVDGLERILHQSEQNSEWETAQAAIKQIREKKPDETPNAVARQLDEEKEAREKLEKKIEELEKRLDATLEGKGREEASTPPQ